MTVEHNGDGDFCVYHTAKQEVFEGWRCLCYKFRHTLLNSHWGDSDGFS